jgi:hypothetical protein
MGLRLLMMKLVELGFEVGRVQGLTDQQEIHHMKRRTEFGPCLLLRLKLRVHA